MNQTPKFLIKNLFHLISLVAILFLSPKVALSVTQNIQSLPQQIMQAEKLQGKLFFETQKGRLPEIAKRYGRKSAEIETLLLTDRTVWLDKYGFIFFTEELPTDTREASIKAFSLDESQEPIFPLSQTFKLHSNSGSKRIIYLDFDGHNLNNTAWNGPIENITASPYDIDDDESGFSDIELKNIQEIWMQVSEDYAPFDVDITTELLDEELIRRTDTNDQFYGTRALITKDTFVLCNCGGIAYLGIYNVTGYVHDFYQPALVFTDKASNGEPPPPKVIAEIISHEVGHNLNLSHDGTSAISYYGGHGSGETGWAPIMGVAYDQPLTQWSQGEYPDSNNTGEDDLQIIQNHGLAIKPDDHSNTNDLASILLTTQATELTSTVSGKGLIEERGDIDVFTFESDVGDISITITPNSVFPNLDINAIITDQSGTQIASSNLINELPSNLVFSSPLGGVYYLQISGSGREADMSTAGYNDYGSLGRYFISGVVNTRIITTEPNNLDGLSAIIFDLLFKDEI